ncbi:MAG: 4Fe-4S dicluster domain-containing protein [Verrucomicrobia bacterium]|nr:4Fe-4S dicluster domain-containing protein [Verrucomicrobiota bacterium]
MAALCRDAATAFQHGEPVSGPNHEEPRRDRLRLAGRWLVLIAAVALAWPLRKESSTSVFLPALSPYVALCSTLAVRSLTVLTLLAVPVLLLVLFSPRWFCRHGCPVGLLQEWVERLRPATSARWQQVPPIGKWLALLTLGGACLGYPLFQWLDPLALFNGFLNAWRQPLAAASLLTGLGLPVLLVLDLVFPRLWCQRVCPLGATQELLAWPRRWRRRSTRCEMEAGGELPCARGFSLARRGFLAACLGGAGAFALRVIRKPMPPLRPPGSLGEGGFTGVCIRCGNCAQACPSRIIQPDFGASGVAGLLTPVLRFEEDYCREDCHRCNEVCPSGAIARLSLAAKRRRVIGPAEVNVETCLLANGRECTACIKRCPYEAITLHSADGGFSTLPRVALGRCTGCGACEAVCPVRPRRAIRVVARPGELAEG